MRWSSVGKRCWGKRERNRRHLVCNTQLITQWTRHSASETRQARKKLVLEKKKCYHTSKYSSQFHTDLHTCGGIGAGAGSFQLYANMCVILPICLPKGLPMLQGDADKWALLLVTLQFPKVLCFLHKPGWLIREQQKPCVSWKPEVSMWGKKTSQVQSLWTLSYPLLNSETEGAKKPLWRCWSNTPERHTAP